MDPGVLDRHGADRRSCAGGHQRETVLEAVDRRRDGSGALRKNEEIFAPLNLFNPLPDECRPGVVRDVAGRKGSAGQGRVAPQAGAHHARGGRKVGEKKDGVQEGGMVGDKDRSAGCTQWLEPPNIQAKRPGELHPAHVQAEDPAQKPLASGGGNPSAREPERQPAERRHGEPHRKKPERGGELRGVGGGTELERWPGPAIGGHSGTSSRCRHPLPARSGLPEAAGFCERRDGRLDLRGKHLVPVRRGACDPGGPVGIPDSTRNVEPFSEPEEVGDLVDGHPGIAGKKPPDQRGMDFGGKGGGQGNIRALTEGKKPAHLGLGLPAGVRVLAAGDEVAPELFERRMVVRGKRGQAEPLVFGSRDELAVRLALPLRDLEPRDLEGFERRPHIRRDLAEILRDEPVASGLLQKDAEKNLALQAVSLAVFLGVVVALGEPGEAAAGPLGRLSGRQIRELAVFLRPPREAVNPEEPERVVDAQQVEDLAGGAKPAAPPREVVVRHRLPVVERKPPVLAPLFREWIALKNLLRRSSARQREVEDCRGSPDVCAREAHPDRDVADERDPELVASGPHRLPLHPGDPLDVAVETDEVAEPLPVGGREPRLPVLGRLARLMRGRPAGRHLAPVPRHQRTELAVRVEPVAFALLEFGKRADSDAVGFPAAKDPERGFKKLVFERLHGPVLDRTLAQRRDVMARADVIKRTLRELGQPGRSRRDRRRFVRHRAQNVVRAVVAAGLVHRQDLHHPESLRCGPTRKLDQRCRVSDAEVGLPAQRAHGTKYSGQLVLGRGFHEARIYPRPDKRCRENSAGPLELADEAVEEAGQSHDDFRLLQKPAPLDRIGNEGRRNGIRIRAGRMDPLQVTIEPVGHLDPGFSELAKGVLHLGPQRAGNLGIRVLIAEPLDPRLRKRLHLQARNPHAAEPLQDEVRGAIRVRHAGPHHPESGDRRHPAILLRMRDSKHPVPGERRLHHPAIPRLEDVERQKRPGKEGHPGQDHHPYRLRQIFAHDTTYDTESSWDASYSARRSSRKPLANQPLAKRHVLFDDQALVCTVAHAARAPFL